MLTFFTTAKPFKGHIDVIQRNALQSWTLLHPDVEIILFGDDQGAAEAAKDLGIRHEPEVGRNEFGTILVSSMFEKAQAVARHDLLCYVNCDIVLLSDFRAAVERVRRRKGPFLLIGKRWDTDVTENVDVTVPSEQEHLRTLARRQDQRRRYEIDYFLFPRGMYRDIPPFGVGRLHWDHWLVWKARSLHAPVIDASYAIMAIHQNHDYHHHPQGRVGVWQGPEPERNWQLAGNGKQLCTFEDATHVLARSGALLRTPWRKAFHEAERLSFHIFVHKTLPMRKALGLRKESLRKLFSRSSTM